MQILTPTQLWQDFDPSAEPLEADIFRTDEENGIVTERFYFTGRTQPNGKKSRVYAVMCYKNTNSMKPGVLLIGDPAEKIDGNELLYFANNGFVAMATDMRGDDGEGRSTYYTDETKFANADGSDDFYIGSNIKETKWYEYAYNSRRAVTFLANQPTVRSVSVLSVGKGGIVGMMVTATDDRVERAAAVFCNLNVSYGGRPTAPSPEDGQLPENEPWQVWETALAPQSYVPLIKVPLYIVCGGNSAEVDVVKLNQSFLRTNDESRLYLIPDAFDYLSNDDAESVIRWLKGKTASDDVYTSVQQRDGLLKMTVRCENNADVHLWYCRNSKKTGKNWLSPPLENKDGEYEATLDLYEEDDELFAVVVLRGEVSVSTGLIPVTPPQGCRLKQKTTLLYSGQMEDFRFVPVSDGENWHGRELDVYKCKGYLNIVGVKGNCFGTFAVGDVCLRDPNGILSFDVCCDVRQNLTVSATADFGKRNLSFFATAELYGDGKWQRVIFKRSDFRSADGRPMNEDAVDLYVFSADKKFIINNVSLV